MSGAALRRFGRRGRLAFLLGLIVSVVAVAVTTVPSSGYPTGSTSPGCSCHGSEDPGVTVDLTGIPDQYEPGQTYSLAVSVQGGPPTDYGGFFLTADGGVFSDPGPHAQILGNGVTHTDKEAKSWTVNWTAPAADYGTVTFDLSGVAANGADGPNGDGWNSATYTAMERRDVPLIPTKLVVGVPDSIRAGEEFTLSATVTEADGTPIEGATVSFSMRATFSSFLMGNATTDSNGTARLDFDQVAGEFLVDVTFHGGGNYSESSATAVLVIEGDSPEGDALPSSASLAVSLVTLILAGVWACFFYVLYLALRISKEGKRA